MKIYYILILCISLFLFPACHTYFIQNLIGNTTVDLDQYSNSKTIKTNIYKPNEAYAKTKNYLYSKKADVYLQEDGKKLYARNMLEIFPFALNTTTVKFEFERNDEKTLIKITSKNLELAEYFYDKLIENLVNIDNNTNQKA